MAQFLPINAQRYSERQPPRALAEPTPQAHATVKLSAMTDVSWTQRLVVTRADRHVRGAVLAALEPRFWTSSAARGRLRISRSRRSARASGIFSGKWRRRAK